jgi:hypothetical protein
MGRAWPRWVRWAWMLPVLQLLVAGWVATPGLVTDYRSKTAVEDHDVATAPGFVPTRTQAVAIFDIPGSFVYMLLRGPLNSPAAVLKRIFHSDPYSQMAILYPIGAIPFWWVLGRSADTASSLKSMLPSRLRWWDLILMLPLVWCGFCGWLWYFSAAAGGTATSCFGWSMAAWGIWGVLSGVVITLWILQKRKRRPLAHQGAA